MCNVAINEYPIFYIPLSSFFFFFFNLTPRVALPELN